MFLEFKANYRKWYKIRKTYTYGFRLGYFLAWHLFLLEFHGIDQRLTQIDNMECSFRGFFWKK